MGLERTMTGGCVAQEGDAPAWFLAMAAVLLLAACAGVTQLDQNTAPEEKQKVVAARAEARWQLLIKGDVESAYAFLSPGSKATTSLALYKGRIKPGSWRKAKADKVTCEGEICSATIQITYDTPRLKGIETQLIESWIIENGTAWYVYR